jgi:hypothetical protein
VKLFVYPWSSSPLFVENGKTINSTWSINIGNGGNDIMYDTSVCIVDSGGLQISPTSADLGNILSKETKLANFNVTAPNTLSTGSKNVSFLISYKDFRGASHIESKILYVMVKLGTSLELTLSSSSVKKEDSILITAKLLDGNGKPIYDEPIDFFVGTESLGLVRTDSYGAANKSYTADVDAGSYSIVTSYAGNNTLLPTSASSDFIVNKLDTALMVDVPSATQGKECVLKAVLSDERDRLLRGIDVDFYFYESDSWKKIGSGVTDANGTASLNYTPSSTGTFQVKAIFNGTLNYSQSFSPASNMTVAVDYTIYLIGGVIIATVIIIVYLILRRKSTPQS